MDADTSVPQHIVHQRTTDALAALIRQQQQVATLCAVCGALGIVIRDERLLCARCGVNEQVWRPANERA